MRVATHAMFTITVIPAKRWEKGVGRFDELNTHQRGARTVLRSKSPDLVLQEIWGHLCCYLGPRHRRAQPVRSSTSKRPRLADGRARMADLRH